MNWRDKQIRELQLFASGVAVAPLKPHQRNGSKYGYAMWTTSEQIKRTQRNYQPFFPHCAVQLNHATFCISPFQTHRTPGASASSPGKSGRWCSSTRTCAIEPFTFLTRNLIVISYLWYACERLLTFPSFSYNLERTSVTASSPLGPTNATSQYRKSLQNE